MSVTVHLPDELAARLAAEAARRGQDIDQVVAELVTAGLTEDHTGTAPALRRRLSFAATLNAEPELAQRAEGILDELTRRSAG